MDAIELVPKVLKDELLRLARLDRDWLKIEFLEEGMFQASTPYETWIKKLWHSGVDSFSLWATSLYYADGPKVYKPSQETCDALAEIEVKLSLSDYAQPYPVVLVVLPQKIGPFKSVLCHKSERVLICVMATDGNTDDVTASISIDGRPMEASIEQFDEGCREHSKLATRVLRIAINACLALANYGCRTEWLRPKERESDERLAREQSERGKRAQERLAASPSLLTFSQEVRLHRTDHRERSESEPTGREMPPHWRRGHWAMQACGPNRSERRRVLRPPVFVRFDKFMGDNSQTQVVYR